MVRLSTSGEYMKFTPATPTPQARPQAQEDAHLPLARADSLSRAGQQRLESLLDAASLAHFGTKKYSSRA